MAAKTNSGKYILQKQNHFPQSVITSQISLAHLPESRTVDPCHGRHTLPTLCLLCRHPSGPRTKSCSHILSPRHSGTPLAIPAPQRRAWTAQQRAHHHTTPRSNHAVCLGTWKLDGLLKPFFFFLQWEYTKSCQAGRRRHRFCALGASALCTNGCVLGFPCTEKSRPRKNNRPKKKDCDPTFFTFLNVFLLYFWFILLPWSLPTRHSRYPRLHCQLDMQF